MARRLADDLALALTIAAVTYVLLSPRPRSMAVRYCAGGHPVLAEDCWTYKGAVYCARHRPPPAPADVAPNGYCGFAGGHPGTAVRYVPSMRIHLCELHFASIVRETIRRGFWKP